MVMFHSVLAGAIACTWIGLAGPAAPVVLDVPAADELRTGGSGCDSGTVSFFECYAPVGSGVTENPNSDGGALFSYDGQSGQTYVDIAIFHFRPNTVYGVRYENEFGTGAELSQAITTNAFGRGRWRDTNISNVTASPRVIIFIDDDHDFAYTPGEERACGGSNCIF